MSLCFRPVNEVWGEHSSCFVDHDLLLRILHCLASEVGCQSEEYAYGDKTSIWIEDGIKTLDYARNDATFTAEHLANALGLNTEALKKLRPLVSNMKSMARGWSDSVDAHGALTFYVDAY